MARFKLNGTVYSTAAIDEISLKHLIRFNGEAEDLGLRRNWSDVERIAEEVNGLTREEAANHPEKFLIIAMTIWTARVVAGEDITLGKAVDFAMKDIEFLPDPGDHKPGKRAAAKKAAPKKKAPAARKGSAAAGSRPANPAPGSSTTSSETPSTTASSI